MPFEVVADKIERIAPEYQGELMQFIVFLFFAHKFDFPPANVG